MASVSGNRVRPVPPVPPRAAPQPHSRSKEERDVVVQNGRILALETERGLKEGSGLAKILVLHLVFAGDEISRRGCTRVALLLQDRERPSIELAVVDQLVA